MLNQLPPVVRPDVLLMEDADLGVSISCNGHVRPGQACQLSIVVNGHDALSFLEDAGTHAPLTAVVHLNVPAHMARNVLDAMRTRPWRHSDMPVIYFACTSPTREGHLGTRVGYLVQNGTVSDMIETIRTTLDITPGPH